MYYIKLLVVALLFLSDGVYDYQMTDISGNQINLSDFQGKKILFVNTATNSEYVDQYASLEQLYQKYKDSLVIIATPSNSFGNEPDSNSDIKNFVDSQYNIHYILAAKSDVAGDSIPAVYQWLTQKNLNQYFQNPVHGDFFKFLVTSNGEMIGIFAPSVDPMDSTLQTVIQTQ